MGNLSDKIKERERKSKQNKLMMNVLGVVVIIFMVSSVLLYSKLKEEKRKLTESETSLLASEKSLLASNKELKTKDSILIIQNKKLLELRGSIDNFWNAAQNSNRMKDYASYLERAIEDDDHYNDALTLLNSLATQTGYVQVTESNGNILLQKIENLNTEDQFYKALSDRSIRRGVINNPDFPNSSVKGTLRTDDVVKVVRLIPSGNAQWAEIRYGN